MDIEDFWIGKFLDKYTSTKDNLTKGYYDIEVDGIDYAGFPDESIAPCEINAITYVNDQYMTCHTYLLRNRNNLQIQQTEDNIEGLKEHLRTTLRDDFEYHIYFFSDELQLITAFFDQVNEDKPDFMGAWNAHFDLNTMINRIKQLGGDPNQIIASNEVPEDLRFAYYVDDKNTQKFCDKGDAMMATAFTTYLDQLIIYAALRKGQGELTSFRLNDIAKEVLNDEKLDYTDTSNIKTLPYDDYTMFVAYNIKDVFLLYDLEKKNEDINMLYSLAKTTRTRISKTMRKTVSLKNLAVKFYKEQGFIIGNNCNGRVDDEKESGPTEKFEGAYVADPELNGNNGIMLNGKRSKYVYEKVIDFDLSALYPSIIRAFNIDTTTQYGRLLIDGVEPSKEFDPAFKFIDCLTSKDYINLGKEYYGLPSPTELARKLLEQNKDS